MKKIKFICIFILINLLFISNLKAASLIVIKDNEIEDFINTLVAPLFQAAHIESKQVNIYLIKNNTPNAFVYDGNNIFVNTGLITFADSYLEVAGVIAHELGHIAAGHLSRADINLGKSNILMVLSVAAMLLATMAHDDSSLDLIGFAGYSGQQVAIANYLSYSRAEEAQADQLAINYLNNTSYSPYGLYSFMKKIQKKEGRETYNNNLAYSWYSTHPSTEARVSFLSNYTEKIPIENSRLKSEFAFVKAKILAIDHPMIEIKHKYNNTNYGNYTMALSLFYNQQYAEASNYIYKIKKPTLYTQELLGDIKYSQNNFNTSTTIYKEIFSQTPNSIISFKLSRSFFAQKDYNNAEKYLKITLKINEDNPAAWHLLSLVYGYKKDYGLANLALAQKYVVLNNNIKAQQFARVALDTLEKGSDAWQDANKIINS